MFYLAYILQIAAVIPLDRVVFYAVLAIYILRQNSKLAISPSQHV